MLESLFNNVAGLKACNFIKEVTSTNMFPCEFCKTFKNIYFVEHLRKAGFCTNN